MTLINVNLAYPPPFLWFLPKCIFYRKGESFVTFDKIIGHIFPENFIEIPQVVRKI